MKYSINILLICMILCFNLYLSAYAKDKYQCDFETDKAEEIFNLLDNGTIYKDSKTTGILCFKNDNVALYVPIRKGIPHGKVEFYYASGNIYMKNQYKKGKAEGLRTWYYEDGKIEKEQIFKNGFIEGIVKVYYPNGNLKEINNVKKGKLEGIAEKYYDDGKTLMIQGNFKNDLLEGIYKEYYKNGKLKLQKEYIDGKLYGSIKEYDENGNITLNRKVENGVPVANYVTYEYVKTNNNIIKKETHWNGNFKNGIEKTYSDDGLFLKEEIPWVNGVVDGVVIEYFGYEIPDNQNGNIKWETPYKNGKKHGIEKGYYETGELETKIPWVNGKREGDYKIYYISGKIKQITKLKNDKQISEQVYFEGGQLEQDSKFTYKNNKQYNEQVVYTEMGKVWGKINYVDGKITSATCGDGRKWTEAEKHNWVNKLSVNCGYTAN